MIALRVVFLKHYMWRVRHSCFIKGVWRCLLTDVGELNTPLFFSAQGSVVNDSAAKEAKSDNIAGAGHLNDAPSGRGRLATREVGGFSFPL